MSLSLYSVFHLNLAFSAIEVEQRREVIERCYWPLLNIIESENWPCGVELSGWTLEQISQIDSSWTSKALSLVEKGLVEIVGSGYCQVIGPLVPGVVNEKNLEIGWSTYERVLGVLPNLLLVPEQAYSAGYAEIVRRFGVQRLVMEWNNPRGVHPEWDQTLLYNPQVLLTAAGEAISVLWNHSITFQKFQRYAHGELDQDDFLSWLSSHYEKGQGGSFSLYGNDAEVFDFRPGRFLSEEPIQSEGEWTRIQELVQRLHDDGRFQFVLPHQVLDGAGDGDVTGLSLETSGQPVPVKKQAKYNLVRWAVTGRDDFYINSRCHEILEKFSFQGQVTQEEWKNLLYLWSSDFRTHITENRWELFLKRLEIAHVREVEFETLEESQTRASSNRRKPRLWSISTDADSRFLKISSKRLDLTLNLRRGLAIHSWTDHALSDLPILGTLPLGTFESMNLGADYYSGHLTFHPPGQPQATDLVAVSPSIEEHQDYITLKAVIPTPLGEIVKTISVFPEEGRLEIDYVTRFNATLGSYRFGYITPFIQEFPGKELSYVTHLGGNIAEEFALGSKSFDHGASVSNLISASHALGATEGYVELTDGTWIIRASLANYARGAVGMISHRNEAGERLSRLFFSAGEVDDTRQFNARTDTRVGLEIQSFRA